MLRVTSHSDKVVIWLSTGERIQERNHIRAMYVTSLSVMVVILRFTNGEHTRERNLIRAMYMTVMSSNYLPSAFTGEPSNNHYYWTTCHIHCTDMVSLLGVSTGEPSDRHLFSPTNAHGRETISSRRMWQVVLLKLQFDKIFEDTHWRETISFQHLWQNFR